ncbi:hypothetical protein BDQ17DRAFT_1434370 [Cyathus striatus]|nr:hypothetical protein BDQ17DRAFT_1434370 [Cyathus striatus]
MAAMDDVTGSNNLAPIDAPLNAPTAMEVDDRALPFQPLMPQPPPHPSPPPDTNTLGQVYVVRDTEPSSKSSSTGELELQDIESNETESVRELVLTIQPSESRSSKEAGPVPGKLEMGSSNKTRSSGELKLQGIESDEAELARDSEVQRLAGDLELQNVQSSEPGPLVGEVIRRDIRSSEAEPVPGILEVQNNQSNKTGLAKLGVQNVQSDDSGLAGEGGLNHLQPLDESGPYGKLGGRNIRSNEIGVTRGAEKEAEAESRQRPTTTVNGGNGHSKVTLPESSSIAQLLVEQIYNMVAPVLRRDEVAFTSSSPVCSNTQDGDLNSRVSASA